MPEVFEQAQVVGKWVWLEFNVATADFRRLIFQKTKIQGTKAARKPLI